MTNYDLDQVKLLEYQIGLSVLSILTIVVSLTLSYNALLNLKKEDSIYSDEEASNILLMNRTVDLFIFLGFLAINIYDHNARKKNNTASYIGDLQISASALSVIAALIVLYVAIVNGNGVTSQENPTT